MKIISLLVIVLTSFSTDGQVRKFKWSTEVCEYEGTYDSRKYKEEQLRDTRKLLSPYELRLDPSKATVWKFEEIAQLDPETLKRQYNEVVNGINSLKHIRTPYFNAIKQAKLREAKQLYELSRVTMLAYSSPKAFHDHNDHFACKAIYSEPLIAGGERLLETWLRVNMDSRKKNSEPDRLKRVFDQQYASPDRFKFALVEVMSFGWWNCANNSIEYFDIGQGEAPEKEFRKLFTRVRTISCDEP